MVAAKTYVKVPNYVLIVSVLAVLIAVAALSLALQKEKTAPIVKTQETELAPYQESTSAEVPLKYVVTEANNITRYYNYSTYVVGNVWLKNVDTETGEFRVAADLTVNGKTTTHTLAYVLTSGAAKRFYFEFQLPHDGASFGYKYTVTPPTKTVTQTTTKYKQVVKTTENSS